MRQRDFQRFEMGVFTLFLLLSLALVAGAPLCAQPGVDMTVDALSAETAELFASGAYAEALDGYAQLVSLFPEDACLHGRLGGCALSEPGRIEMARKHLRLARALGCTELGLGYFEGRLAHLEYNFEQARDLYAAYLAFAGKRGRFVELAEEGMYVAGAAVWAPDRSIELKVMAKLASDPGGAFRFFDPEVEGLRLISTPEALQSKVDRKLLVSPMAVVSGQQRVVYASRGKRGDQGWDLYAVDVDGSDGFGEAQRLPEPINSDRNERDAFWDAEAGVLYFSSDRLGGLGGLDIYAVEVDALLRPIWQPVALPFPVNTVNDDHFFIPESGGATAWFASDRSSGSGATHAFHVEIGNELPHSLPIRWNAFTGLTTGASLTILAGDSVLYSASMGQENGEMLLPIRPPVTTIGTTLRFVIRNGNAQVEHQGRWDATFGGLDLTRRPDGGVTMHAIAGEPIDWVDLAALKVDDTRAPDDAGASAEGSAISAVETPPAQSWAGWVRAQASLPKPAEALATAEFTRAAEQEHLAELESTAEKARLAEVERAAEVARTVEVVRLAEVADAAEEMRLAEVARTAETARLAEVARSAEEMRLAEVARTAEAARLAEVAGVAEEMRLAEVARTAEAARLAEVAGVAEEMRLAEVTRTAEAARLAEVAGVAEEMRLAEVARTAEAARLAEVAGVAEEARLAEVARTAEAARLAEVAGVAEEVRLAEVARTVEAARLAEVAGVAEEVRLAEVARTVEAARLAEVAGVAEEVRLAEVARAAEAARLAEAAGVAEEMRLAEVARAAEAARLAEAAGVAEEMRLAEVARSSESEKRSEVDGEAEAEAVRLARTPERPAVARAAEARGATAVETAHNPVPENQIDRMTNSPFESLSSEMLAAATRGFLDLPSAKSAAALEMAVSDAEDAQPAESHEGKREEESYKNLALKQIDLWEAGFSQAEIEALQTRAFALEIEVHGAPAGLNSHLKAWREAANLDVQNSSEKHLQELLSDPKELALMTSWKQALMHWSQAHSTEANPAPVWMFEALKLAQADAQNLTVLGGATTRLKANGRRGLPMSDPAALLLEVAFPALSNANSTALPSALIADWISRVAVDKRLTRALDRLKRDQAADPASAAVQKRTNSIQGLALNLLVLSFREVYKNEDGDRVEMMLETVQALADESGQAADGVDLLVSWRADNSEGVFDPSTRATVDANMLLSGPAVARVNQSVLLQLGASPAAHSERLAQLKAWSAPETASALSEAQADILSTWLNLKSLQDAANRRRASGQTLGERQEKDLFLTAKKLERLAANLDWPAAAGPAGSAVSPVSHVSADVVELQLAEMEGLLTEAGRTDLVFPISGERATPSSTTSRPLVGLVLRPITWAQAVNSATAVMSTAASVASRASDATETVASEIGINPVDVEPLKNGTVYKVQVGAFRHPVPASLFEAFNPMWAKHLPSGITRYMAGSFADMSPAMQARDAIRDLGYSDAFVVKYVDGERVVMDYANSTSLAVAQPTAPQAPVASTPEVEVVAPNLPRWSDRSGRWFSVQIGAFRGLPDRDVLGDVLELTGEDVGLDGWLRLFSGRFADLASARSHLTDIQSSGRLDAFVVAYEDGLRVALFSTEVPQSNMFEGE